MVFCSSNNGIKKEKEIKCINACEAAIPIIVYCLLPHKCKKITQASKKLTLKSRAIKTFWADVLRWNCCH